MKYLNEDYGILKHLVPDGYKVNSIEDFLEHMEEIPMPSMWKRLSPLIVLAHELFIDHVLVYFNKDLNLRFNGQNYTISDKNTEMDVGQATVLFSDKPWRYKNITDEKCSEVVLMYDVRKSKIYLHSFKESA